MGPDPSASWSSLTMARSWPSTTRSSILRTSCKRVFFINAFSICVEFILGTECTCVVLGVFSVGGGSVSGG